MSGQNFDEPIVDGGARLGLRCIRAELDPAAPAGDIRPLEVKGTEFDLEADTVILAIGQDPALLDWESVIRVSGNMVLVDERQMTSRRGVFAAGDVTNPERFVSTAIGDGKQAAQRIMEYLGQLGTVRGESSTLPEVAFTDLNTFYFPRAERWERDKVDARARAADFREIRQGFAAEQALAGQFNRVLYRLLQLQADPPSPSGVSILVQASAGEGHTRSPSLLP